MVRTVDNAYQQTQSVSYLAEIEEIPSTTKNFGDQFVKLLMEKNANYSIKCPRSYKKMPGLLINPKADKVKNSHFIKCDTVYKNIKKMIKQPDPIKPKLPVVSCDTMYHGIGKILENKLNPKQTQKHTVSPQKKKYQGSAYKRQPDDAASYTESGKLKEIKTHKGKGYKRTEPSTDIQIQPSAVKDNTTKHQQRKLQKISKELKALETGLDPLLKKHRGKTYKRAIPSPDAEVLPEKIKYLGKRGHTKNWSVKEKPLESWSSGKPLKPYVDDIGDWDFNTPYDFTRNPPFTSFEEERAKYSTNEEDAGKRPAPIADVKHYSDKKPPSVQSQPDSFVSQLGMTVFRGIVRKANSLSGLQYAQRFLAQHSLKAMVPKKKSSARKKPDSGVCATTPPVILHVSYQRVFILIQQMKWIFSEQNKGKDFFVGSITEDLTPTARIKTLNMSNSKLQKDRRSTMRSEKTKETPVVPLNMPLPIHQNIEKKEAIKETPRNNLALPPAQDKPNPISDVHGAAVVLPWILILTVLGAYYTV